MKLLQHVEGSSPPRHRSIEVAAPTVGRALLNFGMGAAEARLAITGQTGITAASVVDAWRLVADSANHSADEHLIEDLDVFAGYIVPGVGFSIVGRPRNPARLYGLFHVAWSWS